MQAIDFSMIANVNPPPQGANSVREARAIAKASAEAQALADRARVARANGDPSRAEVQAKAADQLRDLADQVAARLAGKIGQRESDKPVEGVRWAEPNPATPSGGGAAGGGEPPKPCKCEDKQPEAGKAVAADDDEPWRTLAVLALAAIAGHVVGRVVGAIAR